MTKNKNSTFKQENVPSASCIQHKTIKTITKSSRAVAAIKIIIVYMSGSTLITCLVHCCGKEKKNPTSFH